MLPKRKALKPKVSEEQISKLVIGSITQLHMSVTPKTRLIRPTDTLLDNISLLHMIYVSFCCILAVVSVSFKRLEYVLIIFFVCILL